MFVPNKERRRKHLQTENPTIPANVLVCVTDQPSCRRLILAGDAIAKKYNMPVKVVTVLKPGLVSPKTAEVLQTLYNIAGRLGAEMTVLFNDSPLLTIAVHARQTNAAHIVGGSSPSSESSPFIETLKGLLPEIPISIVDEEEQIITFPAFAAHQDERSYV
mgnify:CR=1 FL=1